MLGLSGIRDKIEFSRRTLLGVLSTAFLALVYFWHLGSLTKGFSPAEATNISNSHSLHSLLNSPFNAPHNIFIYGLLKVHHAGIFGIRSVSAVFGLLFIFCFYKIARMWFGPFISWIATLTVATIPLVTLAARSATADIMYLAPIVPVALYFELSHSKQPSKFLYCLLFLSAALALYTLGVIWLAVIGAWLAKDGLKKIASNFSRWLSTLNMLGSLIVLAPLIIAIARSWHLVEPLALIPNFSHPLDLLKSIGWMGLGLIWKTGVHHDLQIGRLAVLNLAEIALAVFGVYAFWSRARSKVAGLSLLVALSVLGAGLSGQLSLLLFSFIAVGLFMAAGLRYLLIEWQGVFPYNPLARGLALVLICLVSVANIYFGVRFSLVAWPHTLATKQVYMLK